MLPNQTLRVLIALLAIPAMSWRTDAHATLYVGAKSTEAVYRFSAEVRTTSRTTVDEQKALEVAEAQVEHLFGPWSLTAIKAVPKQNHKLTIQGITKPSPSTYVIRYSYEGTIVLEQDSNRLDQKTGTYDAYLPVNPSRIYKAAAAGAKSGGDNPCTDSHYQSEGDFWYFWAPAPYYPDCKLELGKDYIVVAGQFERLQNTRLTYPEYHRLADPTTRAIEMSLFFGLDSPDENLKDPDQSADINAPNFIAVRKELEALGFAKRRLTKAEAIKALRDPQNSEIQGDEFALEQHTKETPRGKLVVNLFFGPTGIDEQSRPFHLLYRQALRNHAVVLYNGHSGLGAHLDLKDISEQESIAIHLPQNRYQIYFFNSCTSYTYYNLNYLRRKRSSQDPQGTKNLDIFTNGLSTYFHVLHQTDTVLLRAIHDWATEGKWMSYQEMAALIDSDNLFGINGDEDNPTAPIER